MPPHSPVNSRYAGHRRWLAVLALLLALTASIVPANVARAATLPAGFQESVVFSGLTNPTAVRFAADGRVFVAEKSGVIKVFDNLTDTTPTIFADLNVNVYNFWDRGLLGLALDPNFPATPYVYVLYSYDAAIGGAAPRWGTPGVYSDPCPTPPGPTDGGCVVSGRLSRLQMSGSTMTGSEQVLIEDWCQQYPSHSIGSMVFGADGALYVSGGDGASFTMVDYGQNGSPPNPCGDPVGEGGTLRSQDLRTSSDPVSLDGTIIRVDPTTGHGLSNNPLAGNSDPNARRVVAYGLRNPFRITARPGTSEIWIGDVGWNDWEEINRLANPTDGATDNFGWPCYEGEPRQSAYDGTNLAICENLYTTPQAVTSPYFAYRHTDKVVDGESCSTGGSAISGLSFQFYSGGSYPADFDDALFFADYSRNCIWVMYKNGDGSRLPNPASRKTFVAGAANPIDLQIGPGGDLFYVDFNGSVRRIRYVGTDPQTTSCPVGQYLAEYFNNMTLSGSPVLSRCETSIDYDWGEGSPASGVAADNFSVRWTGQHSFADGQYTFTATSDDGIRVWLDEVSLLDAWVDQSPTTYQVTRAVTAGQRQIKVEYYENGYGAVARLRWQTASTPQNSPPTVSISTPTTVSTWRVGDRITFSGTATDAEDGLLPASALNWALILHHNDHTHLVQNFPGVNSGSFVAPDHDYPSYLELQLSTTDSGGRTSTTSVQLNPQTVVLTFRTDPSGLQLVVGSTAQATPFNRTVIVGSQNSVSAPSPQRQRNKNYQFGSWSNGGAQTHTLRAGGANATYTATFLRVR